MKVSTENDNNFGYEKITILVDNIGLGNPEIFPSINFFFILHHGIVMSKYIFWQSFKKFHRAIFSIAHPKYSNFVGIPDVRW
jgi:hypothetical protein